MSGNEKTGNRKNFRIVLLLLIGVGGFYLVVNSAMSKGGQTKGTVWSTTPSELMETPPKAGSKVRLAGIVVMGSYRLSADEKTHTFLISDDESNVGIEYTGVLPDMFEQGKQVMSTGTWRGDGTVLASELSTKCPSKYEGGASEEAEQRSLQYEGKSY